jgi:hypothetical protein
MALSAKLEVISDSYVRDVFSVHTRLYQENDNTLAICLVHIHKDRTAEIYTIDVLEENNKRKHYGSKLWHFTEEYVVNKYHPSRFVGELDLEHIPAVEFWKSLNFQIRKDKHDYGEIVKDVLY